MNEGGKPARKRGSVRIQTEEEASVWMSQRRR